MAASSGNDVPTQLAALFGKDDALVIWKTGKVPPRASVVDLIAGILNLKSNNAAFTFARLRRDYLEVGAACGTFKFKGRRRRSTAVAGVRTCVEILLLCVQRRLGASIERLRP